MRCDATIEENWEDFNRANPLLSMDTLKIYVFTGWHIGLNLIKYVSRLIKIKNNHIFLTGFTKFEL